MLAVMVVTTQILFLSNIWKKHINLDLTDQDSRYSISSKKTNIWHAIPFFYLWLLYFLISLTPNVSSIVKIWCVGRRAKQTVRNRKLAE